MILAAAALLLACAVLAAPAFGQAKAGDVNIQFADCDQVQAAAAVQYQYGVAELAQELNITQEQVLTCLGDRDDVQDAAGVTAADTGKEDVLADTIVKGTLPDTGGFPILAGAACALVIGGVFSITRLMSGRR